MICLAFLDARSAAGAVRGKNGSARDDCMRCIGDDEDIRNGCTGDPRLVLLVLWTCLAGVFPAAAQQSDTRVALLIGNAAYPDAEAPLRDPVNNVRSLADELRQNGFDVDIGENLTKEAMRAAIDRFYGKIKSGSTALLFSAATASSRTGRPM